jgi:PAS domain S-box-containing protein
MKAAIRVLLVEDSTDDAILLARHMERAEFEVIIKRVVDAPGLATELQTGEWDIVISDYSLPRFSAPEALRVLHELKDDTPFIVVSGSIGEDTAVAMMRQGAADYILKDNLARLIPAIRRELGEAENRRQRRLTEEANRRLEAERAELLERLKQENEDLNALTHITANAVSTLDLDGLLQTLLGRVVEIMRVDAATVLLADGDRLSVRASLGVANLQQSTYVHTVGTGFVGLVAREQKPVYVEDAATNPLIVDPLVRERGLRSMLGVPLKRSGRLVGVLHAGWLTVRPRREREVHLLEITAERCAAAIQNARLYEEATNAAAELRASEERFRQLAESIDEVFWITNPEKPGMAYISPGYETVWGRTCASLYASPGAWIEAIHPNDRALVRDAIANQTSGGYDIQYRIARPDGEIRFIHDRAFPVRNSAGVVFRIVGVASDITARHEAEDLRRASEGRFKAIFQAEPECVKVIGRDGTLLQMNPAGLAMLEADSLPQVIEHSLIRFLDPAYRAGFESMVQRALGGEAGKLEFEITGLNGTRRWLESHAAPLPDGDGQSTRMLAVTRDVTEAKRAQEALRLSLREKEALLKEVHHRVKNNLQVIASLLRLERQRSKGPAARLVLGEMKGRIQSMALLHETLYRTSNFAALDLGAYLGSLATQTFRALLIEPSSVKLDLALQPVMVGLDQAIPCGLLLHELLSNTLKHAFPNQKSGEVRVELERLNERDVRLRVSDTGVGLADDFAATVGLSLGLQLVSDLARQLGGELKIESGPGAIFAVTFVVDEGKAAGRKGFFTEEIERKLRTAPTQT